MCKSAPFHKQSEFENAHFGQKRFGKGHRFLLTAANPLGGTNELVNESALVRVIL